MSKRTKNRSNPAQRARNLLENPHTRAEPGSGLSRLGRSFPSGKRASHRGAQVAARGCGPRGPESGWPYVLAFVHRFLHRGNHAVELFLGLDGLDDNAICQPDILLSVDCRRVCRAGTHAGAWCTREDQYVVSPQYMARRRNLWVSRSANAAVVPRSGGIFGRWIRRSAALLPSRSGRAADRRLPPDRRSVSPEAALSMNGFG